MGTLQVCGCKMTRVVKTVHLCSEQGTQSPESPQVSLPGTPRESISGHLGSGSVRIFYYAICSRWVVTQLPFQSFKTIDPRLWQAKDQLHIILAFKTSWCIRTVPRSVNTRGKGKQKLSKIIYSYTIRYRWMFTHAVSKFKNGRMWWAQNQLHISLQTLPDSWCTCMGPNSYDMRGKEDRNWSE